MDNKRIEEKLDKVVEKIGNIDVTLAKQSVILDEHVRRSNLLEAKMLPLEKHVAVVNGALKFLGTMAILATIIEVALKIVGK